MLKQRKVKQPKNHIHTIHNCSTHSFPFRFHLQRSNPSGHNPKPYHSVVCNPNPTKILGCFCKINSFLKIKIYVFGFWLCLKLQFLLAKWELTSSQIFNWDICWPTIREDGSLDFDFFISKFDFAHLQLERNQLSLILPTCNWRETNWIWFCFFVFYLCDFVSLPSYSCFDFVL